MLQRRRHLHPAKFGDHEHQVFESLRSVGGEVIEQQFRQFEPSQRQFRPVAGGASTLACSSGLGELSFGDAALAPGARACPGEVHQPALAKDDGEQARNTRGHDPDNFHASAPINAIWNCPIGGGTLLGMATRGKAPFPCLAPATAPRRQVRRNRPRLHSFGAHAACGPPRPRRLESAGWFRGGEQ